MFRSTTIEDLGNTTKHRNTETPKTILMSICERLDNENRFVDSSRKESEFILWSPVHGAAILLITESSTMSERQQKELSLCVCRRVVAGLVTRDQSK